MQRTEIWFNDTQRLRSLHHAAGARAAAKQANKFLASRGLQKSDRDDVIAAAMLWCWENRDNYSLTTTLETWFMNAIRDAYKSLQRDEVLTSDQSIEQMGGGDDTYNAVAAESSGDGADRRTQPDRQDCGGAHDGRLHAS